MAELVSNLNSYNLETLPILSLHAAFHPLRIKIKCVLRFREPHIRLTLGEKKQM